MLKKIRVFDLQVGMYVVDTGLSWIDHPYLYCAEGFIESEDQLKTIRSDGYAEVFIETSKDAQQSRRIYDKDDIELAQSHALRAGLNQCKNNKNAVLSEEMQEAGPLLAKSLSALAQATQDAAKGAPLELEACTEAAEAIADSVIRNRDALVCLTLLHDASGYHIKHGVGVAVYASALGDYLGLSRPQVGELALAGLLHDIGKALLPLEILEKPEKLSHEEFQEVMRHPADGAEIVARVMPDAGSIQRGVAEHHERRDGSGYPRGLRGVEQSLYGRILAIADVFGAVTQDRPYRARLLPDKAMSALYSQRKKHFDPGLLERFIKCMGVYPVGSLVKLNSGECAVVSQSNPATPLRPKVAIVFDRDMSPMHPVQMDLSGREGPAPAKNMDIQNVLDHRDLGVRGSDYLLAL